MDTLYVVIYNEVSSLEQRGFEAWPGPMAHNRMTHGIARLETAMARTTVPIAVRAAV